MAASVQILCPNGRRQNIKVTPNSKLLQVLEEVCQRQGFIPAEDYNLIHGRKELDLTMSMRFTNLPNNAQLELVKATKTRVEQNVTIALQLASGQRPQASFSPNVTLWDVLLHFEETNSDLQGSLATMEGTAPDSLHPVCIFMREEVIGKPALQATTLKKLALTSGKAIIRLLHRAVKESEMAEICEKLEVEKLKQAKLQAIAQKKSTERQEDEARMQVQEKVEGDTTLDQVKEDSCESMETDKSQDQTTSTSNTTSSSQEQSAPEARRPETSDSTVADSTVSSSCVPDQLESSGSRSAIDDLRGLNLPGVEIFTPDDFHDLNPQEQAIARRLAQRLMPQIQSSLRNQDASQTRQDLQQNPQEPTMDFSNFKFPEETSHKDSNLDHGNSSAQRETVTPCARDILVFDRNETLHSSQTEVSDDFFEVTQEDVKSLYRDRQRAIQSLEDQPLLTRTMRDTQAEAMFDCYKKIIIRVQFPDRLVVQAFFKPRETVKTLYAFVKDCLADKTIKFYLYTTPPKTNLKNMSSSLAFNQLAPAALVHFGSNNHRDCYLKEELTRSRAARISAELAIESVLKSCQDNTSSSAAAGTSSVAQPSPPPSSSSSSTQSHSFSSSPSTRITPSGGQVPKWLKLGKK